MRPLIRHRSSLVLTYLGIAALLLIVQGSLFPATWLPALGLAPSPWWHVPTVLAMGALVLLKYTRPVTALGLGAGILLVDLGLGAALGVWLCFTDLVYYAGLRGDRRWLRRIELTAVVLTLCVVTVPFGLGWGLLEAINIGLLVGLVLLLPLWWSTEVRLGHPLGHLSEEREALEAERSRLRHREQELSRQAAVAAERRRMAQDLHDGVAAHVSAAALRSAAALQAAPDAERDREALASVRVTSLAALEDLRAMVTLLRDGDAAPEHWGAVQTPQQAVDQARETGLEVRLSGDGLEGLPQAAAGPVLNEALMNVLAHGDPERPVTVEVIDTSDEISVTITSALRHADDDNAVSEVAADHTRTADHPGESRPFLATGTGLASMHDRISRSGGDFSAGPEDERWVVRLRLPAPGDVSQEQR